MLDLKYNFNLGSDNGTPMSITNNRVSDRSQTFSYDKLNRIAAAQTPPPHASDPAVCWGQAFGYDSTGNWSNLLSISGVSSAYTGCTQGSLSVTVTAKNQITGDTYDAAGNLMTVPGTGGATYVFNAENQMTSSSNSSMNYLYDGDGNRVEKSGSKIYWYSGSEVLDETDTAGSVTNASFNEYIFFGGNRIARRDSSGNVFYYLTDQLGSSRVIAEVPSGQTTATLCYDADFEPFGGEHTYSNTCPQNYKFTSKERDTESNLDNFGARYYASTAGRFMSPDWALKPLAVPYANFGDPQTLNLYTYVENSPLNRIDADGHSMAMLNPKDCVPHCTDNQVDGSGGKNAYQEQLDKNHGLAQTKVTLNNNGSVLCPGSCPGLKAIKDGAQSIVNAHDGAVVLLSGAAQITATTKIGNAKKDSKETFSAQLLPSIGATIDVRMPAPNPANGQGGAVSVGTPFVSGAVNINNGGVSGITLSAGGTIGVGAPLGVNASAEPAVYQRIGNTINNAISRAGDWLLEHGLD
jgi:RHS repeat-associated protein